MRLPETFCWTKFGHEAGEAIERIFERKEIERKKNDGVFLWGIGNALGPSIIELLKINKSPDVIFSPIKSKPRTQDVKPDKVVVWQAGLDLAGRRVALPEHSIVTSGIRNGVVARNHYALFCQSFEKLEIDFLEDYQFQPSQVRNIRSGKNVGASQVTSVVKKVSEKKYPNESFYPITLCVKLIFPYFIKLIDPIGDQKLPTLGQFKTPKRDSKVLEEVAG